MIRASLSCWWCCFCCSMAIFSSSLTCISALRAACWARLSWVALLLWSSAISLDTEIGTVRHWFGGNAENGVYSPFQQPNQVCVILPLTTEPTLLPAPPPPPPPTPTPTSYRIYPNLPHFHNLFHPLTPLHKISSTPPSPPLPSSHKESLLASHPLTIFHCKHLSTKQLTCMNYPALPAALVSFHPQSPLPPVTVQLQVILRDETFIVTIINTAKISHIHSTRNNESSVI